MGARALDGPPIAGPAPQALPLPRAARHLGRRLPDGSYTVSAAVAARKTCVWAGALPLVRELTLDCPEANSEQLDLLLALAEVDSAPHPGLVTPRVFLQLGPGHDCKALNGSSAAARHCWDAALSVLSIEGCCTCRARHSRDAKAASLSPPPCRAAGLCTTHLCGWRESSASSLGA
jgi:hypothetical protein